MPPRETRALILLDEEGDPYIQGQWAYVYDNPLIQEDEWRNSWIIKTDHVFDRRFHILRRTIKEGLDE